MKGLSATMRNEDASLISYDIKAEYADQLPTESVMGRKATPTLTTYTEWQTAYDFFNKELFGGQLPECVITLDSKNKHALGYFVSNRYESEYGEIRDGLSMNPFYFRRNNLLDTLSTLVHEMCHVWRHHFGKGKSKRTYHCKIWGAQMKRIGLMPSKTGEQGGAQTGQQMTHYVIKGGPFEKACERLLVGNFSISWAEAVLTKSDNLPKGTDKKDRNKHKYSCPCRRVAVWGKPDLHIVCGKYKINFRT